MDQIPRGVKPGDYVKVRVLIGGKPKTFDGTWKVPYYFQDAVGPALPTIQVYTTKGGTRSWRLRDVVWIRKPRMENRVRRGMKS